MKTFLPLALLVLLAGCGRSSNLFPIGPQSYRIIVTPSTWGDNLKVNAKVQERAFREAHDFCQREGKVMVPAGSQIIPGNTALNTPQFELTFFALDPDDPRTKQPTALTPGPDIRIRVE